MQMKKIIAGIVASALTITSVAITGIVVNAAAVQTLPSGNEQVLYSADLSSVEKTTDNYKEIGNVGIPNIDPKIMENENVYVKMTFSDLGTAGNNNDPVADIVRWWDWDSYSGWLFGAKWYNNYSGEFDVKFVPLLANDTIAAYVSISDFTLDQYNQIGGNLQSGNCSVTEIASLQIVEFVEAELDENGELPLPSNEIPIEELEKYESIRVTYKPTPTTDCGDAHGDNGPTYCTWSALNIVGKLKDSGVAISESKKTDWYQPTPGQNFATNEDKEEISVVIPVDDIIALFTSDSDWDDYSLKCILFNQWHLTITKVTGKPVEKNIPVTSITLDENKLSLKKGETAVLTATVAPIDTTDKTVTWKSSDEEIATVDENGEVTAVGSGKAIITAKAGEKTATCEVTVTTPVTGITLDKTELSLEKGKSATLTATVIPNDADDKTVTWTSSATAVATVDQNGKVTAVGGGKAVITAKAGDKSATCEVTVTVPVTGITLDKNELSLEKGKSATLAATVIPDDADDKTVTWTSSATAVATVDQNGKVTAVGGGKAVITAKAGDKSATCEVTVTVPVEEVTLDQTSLLLKVDDTATLTATVKPTDATDKTVTWTTDDDTVATVVNGVVTAVGKGKATITAKVGGKSATCTVTVIDPAKEIFVEPITVLVGEEKAVTITVDPADAKIDHITYTSSDEKIFTITDGKVKGVSKGTATLTVTAANEGNTKLTTECIVTVTDNAIAATAITISETAVKLEVEETKTLTATLTPADSTDKITWISSDETIVSVDETGKITALKVGEATITAKANETVSAQCKVTVTAKTIAVESITLDKTSAELIKGDTLELTATVKPDDATDKTVTWTSSDEKVATVDENGKVTAVGGGKATITAKASSKSATCEVIVTVPVTSVTLNKNELSLEKDGSEVLTAVVAPDDATDMTVTWTSSNATVAVVDENGKVTAVGGGKAVITAKAGDKSATCEVTVTVPVTGITLDKTELSLEKGESAELTAAVEPEDATDKTVTWTSSDEKVATVDENGKVTAIAAGTATITAKAGDKSATCEVTVTVPVTGITLDKTELSLEKGESAELTATVEPEDATDKTVTWSSSDEKVATVDENGKVTAVAEGTAIITAKIGDMTATCTVTVTLPVVSVTGITLDKTELSLEKGESAELTAAVEPEDATDKTVTWSSSDEKVATVDENGKVTAIAAGTATITAKAGDMSATCSITVTEKAEDTKPDVTEPDVTKPDVTEPDVTEPGVTEPDATEPNTSNDGKDDENNKPTGVAIALVPAVTAAAAAVIFKKRK